MTNDEIEKARTRLTSWVHKQFNEASVSFDRNSSGENWARLEEAMWAMQAVNNNKFFANNNKVELYWTKVGLGSVCKDIAKEVKEHD